MGDYRYYQCQSRTNQSRCSYHTWRSTVLEEMVVAQITDKLNSKTLHTNIQDHDSLALQSIWKTQERLKNQTEEPTSMPGTEDDPSREADSEDLADPREEEDDWVLVEKKDP